MKQDFEPAANTYDECECLELAGYEVLAQRSAILRNIRAEIGIDMEFELNLPSASDLVGLHKALLKQTTRCVEIIRRLEAAQYKARGNHGSPASGKSDAP